MAGQTTTNTTTNNQESTSTPVKFCPICGSQMQQGMRYGFLCWICPDPECDYDEPV